ncbi:FAD-binding dehydrogenase [Lysinibacillus sp. OL1_EC]|uniref:FAD-binding dehydrogenase n=1 Tax=unclassified Lysinibacillus TaxID=2636778 RepID=UPI00103B4638|nr:MULTISPECIES: FAD-binding dehydrogenase [unclassified Lysinibacillus]MCM0625260.1 FAD-binding dehydrogenase [Lysinibacillus sp. OL1_EC]MCS5502948.1 FAD-binding dehydrogenase [Lysinibacillus sp. A4]TBV87281.1 FAD-binding dehydrogenase [Lysinibacillus sp. OL1]UKJ44788.1 FAD-binding dehydrogenase [Lysinibacillus sp. ACHW1.5]WGT39861.1 FAD-binding dehydrogenase [Lysinibacillus sp. 1 U-2021]
MKYDVAIVGAGLAGLVAACELIDAKKKVLLVDQEPENSIGGQAYWSFGGIFLVNSPEQRRLGIKDSKELAWQDWQGTAGFDRLEDEDSWAYKWARAYVDFAAGEKYDWLKSKGIKFFPVVGWAERGGSLAGGHGNSVPRFHIVWGTGPGIVKPFVDKVKQAMREGFIDFKPRHRVDEFVQQEGKIIGVSGTVLAETFINRGEKSSRLGIGEFSYEAKAVIVASGGIGANFDLVRKNWPARLGIPPKNMVCGVPAYVDGRMLEITEHAGGRIVNRDRMWHYTEGLRNWDPIWPNHGIRILPGPSSLWFDAEGNRFHAPNFPGFDTLSTLEAIQKTGYDYSWFILTEKIIEKEFALSGSEQNPDLTNKSIGDVLKRILPGPPAPIQAFKNHGEDFVIAHDLKELVDGMNKLAGNELLDFMKIKEQILARDREMDNKFTKDLQVNAIHGARNYIGDKWVRVAKPHKILDTKNWPLIAVRLNILTRKTLGGLQTNLNGAVLGMDGQPIPGLYAAGEVSGFGGGGVHGYRALEGTFVGGCLFSGRQVGRYLGQG